MGWVASDDLKQAGDHLLGILGRESTICYSRVYSETVDPAALARECGLDENDAHVLIEYAAGQLERAGLVAFAPLEQELIDGEKDYTIALTERGRDFLAAGKPFRYRDMYL